MTFFNFWLLEIRGVLSFSFSFRLFLIFSSNLRFQLARAGASLGTVVGPVGRPRRCPSPGQLKFAI